MTTYFISDLHLDESRPQITEIFFNFLRTTIPNADALYILGDLFEVWIGDDEKTPLQLSVAKALSDLAEYHVPVYFIHGNRDFLIGKKFAKLAKIKLLKDPTCINLYGQPTLLMHGDTLCTKDVAYLKFRKKVRNPILQKLFLLTSLKRRKKIAQKYRQGSEHHKTTKDLSIMDVTQDAVCQTMQHFKVQRLIHGHTHRPDLHTFQLNQHKAERIVLASWHVKGQCLSIDKTNRITIDYFL